MPIGHTSRARAANLDTADSVDVVNSFYELKSGLAFAYIKLDSNPNAIQFSWNQPNSNTVVNGMIEVFPVFSFYRIDYMYESAKVPVTRESCLANDNWHPLKNVTEARTQTERTVRTVDNGRTMIQSPAYFRLTGAILRSTGTEYLPLACGKKTLDPSNPLGNPDEVVVRFVSNPAGAKVTIGGKTLSAYTGRSGTKETTTTTITAPRQQGALLQVNTIVFSLPGYKDATINETFESSKVVTAALVKKDSSDQSTVTTDDNTTDPSSTGVAPPDTPNGAEEDCRKYLGLLGHAMEKFSLVNWFGCNFFKFVNAVLSWVTKAMAYASI